MALPTSQKPARSRPAKRRQKNNLNLRLIGLFGAGIIGAICTLVGISVLLLMPTPAALDRNATATAYYATSDALKQSYFATQTAQPTRTPLPTSTLDTRSPFEQCVQSGRGVRYVISGRNVEAVSLTWENDTGGTEQGDYKVPFCKTYNGFESGAFLYISAQIASGGGSIKCQIYDEKTLIAAANASGFASIATCSGSAN